MKRMNDWKRRRLIVSPEFQWPIALKALLLAVLVSGLFAWSTFYFMWKSAISSGNLSLVSVLFQPGLWIGWGICLLGCLILSGFFLLKLTQRVAGQMHRFEKTLDQVLSGNGGKAIYTRKADYFHDFEACLNRYLNLEN